MLTQLLDGMFIGTALLLLPVLWRLWRGPSAADRLLAGELGSALLTFMLGILGTREGSEIYLDAALLVALLAFISTMAIARFLIGQGAP